VCGHGQGGAHRCGCQTDSDCKNGQICDTADTDGDGDKHECIDDPGCNNNDKNCPGFDAVCHIPAHDNCFYCSGKDCEHGCIDNNNCPTTHPVCGHGQGGAHRCGCQTDSDCKNGQICDTADTDGDGDKHECIDRLSCNNDDKKCPGFDTTCKIDLTTFEHSECFYCAGEDCKPGCADDSVCPTSFPICGHGGSDHHCGCNADIDCVDVPGKDRCNTHTYQCEASTGKQPLDSITLYSKSCTGCTKEGVVVSLLGVEYGPYVNGVPCTTGLLDHKGSVDFSGGSTEFNGRIGNNDDDHEREMMGSCYKMGLNYVLHDGGNVTWAGDGSWEPNGRICVDWEDKGYYVWTCNLIGSSPVWQMEGCHINKGVTSCP